MAGDAAWRGFVRPRHRQPDDASLDALLSQRVITLSEIDALVREFEDGRGLPVLVRQYWKLGARVLGFSVDPAFGHSLDGLMMVDLTQLPAAALQRYLGGAAAFRRHHGLG